MSVFSKLLGITLIASVANNFVWFALTYFSYLATKSVISTGFVGGVFLIITTMSSFWFGALVDHNRKKTVLLGSSLATLFFFTIGEIIFLQNPIDSFSSINSPIFWVFVFTLLLGVVAGGLYSIAIPTLISILVPESDRDRANGKFGTINGISFAITSTISGLGLGYGGMSFVLAVSIIMTVLALILLSIFPVHEDTIVHLDTHTEDQSKIDIAGTIATIKSVPGLPSLILFTTFNNFVGGVFMALMDAYGLTLVTVEQWGILWGFLSLWFIVSGLYISKNGLGNNPVRSLFVANIVIWTSCMFFPVQPSIVLLAIGSSFWMFSFPFIEACEQTIIQKVIPPARMGRVFGFAHSIEQAASPITAFIVGPLTQIFFIPLMTDGAGAQLVGSWFGTGPGRGMALVFIGAGLVGLTVTLLSMRSRSYRLLSSHFLK